VCHSSNQGASREFWKRYAANHFEPVIGFAGAAGVLRHDESPEELLRRVAGLIEFYAADESGS